LLQVLDLGEHFLIDLGAKEVEPDKPSVELSFTGDVKFLGLEFSLTLDHVREQDSSGEWVSQSDIKASVPDNLGGSAYIEYDIQEGPDSGFEMNPGVGVEKMFFYGVGDNLDEW